MHAAPEFQTIRPGVFFWQVYEPAVKTELCSCAFETPAGLVFCDPVLLAEEALEELTEGRKPAGILLTNGNHERNAPGLAGRFGIDIWAHLGARDEVAATRWFEDGEALFGAEAVRLEGFAPGETAFWIDGLLIIGDALIHAPPFGFSMLPEKYCEDAKAGRESLKRLAGLPVDLLAFAHGLPIVSRARERLAALIG
jgi:hypothetical protein